MIRWFGAIRVEFDRKALSQVLDLPALLFGELFASLGGLANFLSDYFPLVGVVVFDSLHQGCTEIADLVFRELGVVHVFIPMLLYAAFGAQRERLCDLAPAAAGISQRLEPLFFGGRPRCVCAPFLWQGTW